MGWFWADATPSPAVQPPPSHPPFGNGSSAKPPPGCPMHDKTVGALSMQTIQPPPSNSKPSGCPVPHEQRTGGCPVNHEGAQPPKPAEEPSTLSKLNPLNFMFHTISQERAPNQSVAPADVPAKSPPSLEALAMATGNTPPPQQMYNALLRKGYTDTDATAVESMVAVHNFLNEGAWSEIVDWERRFGRGLYRGWQISSRGEENAEVVTRMMEQREGGETEPKLLRFQGRPGEMTPKAAMVQFLGRIYPSKFATEPPFDRHDWYVQRNINGKEQEVRYVIDYYTGPPEPTGEPVFYLDVRPAMTPTGAVERLMRWGGDVWWRASGGEARESWPKLS